MFVFSDLHISMFHTDKETVGDAKITVRIVGSLTNVVTKVNSWGEWRRVLISEQWIIDAEWAENYQLHETILYLAGKRFKCSCLPAYQPTALACKVLSYISEGLRWSYFNIFSSPAQQQGSTVIGYLDCQHQLYTALCKMKCDLFLSKTVGQAWNMQRSYHECWPLIGWNCIMWWNPDFWLVEIVRLSGNQLAWV